MKYLGLVPYIVVLCVVIWVANVFVSKYSAVDDCKDLGGIPVQSFNDTEVICLDQSVLLNKEK